MFWESCPLRLACLILIYFPSHDLIQEPCLNSLCSCVAATGPNPRVGHPLQGPGVLYRDHQMDGTWAPIERSVTATSSKCPVFKGTEGELYLSQMFQTLCQPVIIPATSLPPRCLHRCIQNTDFLLPPLLRTLCPCRLSLSLTLSYTHNTPRSVSQMQKATSESGCAAATDEIHLFSCSFWSESLHAPQRMLGYCLIKAHQHNWYFVTRTSGNLCRKVMTLLVL